MTEKCYAAMHAHTHMDIHYNYYYCWYYFLRVFFFTPALADGLSLESEIQQVSSGLLAPKAFHKYLSGIIVITYNNGESVFLWKIPLWIFTSAKVFPPAFNSTFQFFIASVMNFMTLSDILYIFRYYYYLLLFVFFTPASTDSFLLEFEWRQVSSRWDSSQFIADLNNVVVWIDSTCPLFSPKTFCSTGRVETAFKYFLASKHLEFLYVSILW